MCFASAPLIRLPLRSIRFRLPFFLLRIWPRFALRLVDSPEAVILKRFLIPLCVFCFGIAPPCFYYEVYVQICPNKGDGGVSRASPEAVKSVPIPSHLTGKRQEYRHPLIVNSSELLQRFRFTGKGLRQMAEDSCPSGQDSTLL